MRSPDPEEPELQRLNRLYAALSRINQAIVRLPGRDELFNEVCHILVKDGGFTMAWIGWLEASTQQIAPVASWGDDQGYTTAIRVYADDRAEGRGPTGTAFRAGKPYICNDIANDPVMQPWHAAAARAGYRASAVFPIRFGRVVLGALNVYADQPGFFRDRETALLEEVAVDVSFALDNLERLALQSQSQRALQHSEQRFRSLFRHMLDGYAYCRAIFDGDRIEDIEYLDVNPAAEQLTGLRGMIGHRQSELVPGVNQASPEVLEMCTRVTRSGTPERGEFFIAPLNMWLSLAVYSPDRQHFIALFDDITQRKRAEHRIAEQAALIDQARDAIFVCTLDYEITYWSKGAERVYGWPAAEAVGRQADDLFLPQPDAIRRARESTLTTGGWVGELEKVSRAGETITVESRGTLVRDAQGQPRSILVIDTDITDRKQLEQHVFRAQRMESIGSLASGMAHDLGNVFAPIIMSLDLLKAEPGETAREELLDVIGASARRGAEMVKQVLHFARGVTGQRSAVSLGSVIHDVAAIIRETFPRQIELQTRVADDLWSMTGDSTQMHQVLMNLCINARDAMPSGGQLTVTASNVEVDDRFAAIDPEARPGNHLLLTVEDSGCGIPRGQLERIFDPLYTTKAAGQGTGLGLSTSLAIVRNHGGFIRVYSEPRMGSRFNVFLPAQAAPAAGIATRPEPEMPRGHGQCILVVDDEAAVREIARQTLETYGYRVLAAGEGSEAVALFREHQADIAAVLIDMMMPVLDGPATIGALRKLDPNVRIIAASGLAASAHAELAASPQVVRFLTKPYSAQSLLAILREALPGE